MYIGSPYPPVGNHHGHHEISPPFQPSHPSQISLQQLHPGPLPQSPTISPTYTTLKQLIKTIVSWLQTVDAEFADWKHASFQAPAATPHSNHFLPNPPDFSQVTAYSGNLESETNTEPSPHPPLQQSRTLETLFASSERCSGVVSLTTPISAPPLLVLSRHCLPSQSHATNLRHSCDTTHQSAITRGNTSSSERDHWNSPSD